METFLFNKEIEYDLNAENNVELTSLECGEICGTK